MKGADGLGDVPRVLWAYPPACVPTRGGLRSGGERQVHSRTEQRLESALPHPSPTPCLLLCFRSVFSPPVFFCVVPPVFFLWWLFVFLLDALHFLVFPLCLPISAALFLLSFLLLGVSCVFPLFPMLSPILKFYRCSTREHRAS